MITCRPAGPADAADVAALHADSWRRHYRGAYSDRFLDGDVAGDRLAVWTHRLEEPESGYRTVLAEDGESAGAVVGFAHVVLDEDPTWGALLDNLHVVYTRKRSGIGTLLLGRVARAVEQEAARARLYLWVLEQNTAAQAFYRALGGERVGHKQISPPGGEPANLDGTPVALRMAWSDPAPLARRYRVDERAG